MPDRASRCRRIRSTLATLHHTPLLASNTLDNTLQLDGHHTDITLVFHDHRVVNFAHFRSCSALAFEAALTQLQQQAQHWKQLVTGDK